MTKLDEAVEAANDAYITAKNRGGLHKQAVRAAVQNAGIE